MGWTRRGILELSLSVPDLPKIFLLFTYTLNEFRVVDPPHATPNRSLSTKE
jgi:hypothetical protein